MIQRNFYVLVKIVKCKATHDHFLEKNSLYNVGKLIFFIYFCSDVLHKQGCYQFYNAGNAFSWTRRNSYPIGIGYVKSIAERHFYPFERNL